MPDTLYFRYAIYFPYALGPTLMARGSIAPRRCAPGHFPQNSPIISGSFAKNDLQL